MKLINPSVEIIEQSTGINGIYKQIELAGRVCYKSEDRITEDSAKEFVDRMIKSGHGAMLEHGTVYLTIPYNSNENNAKYYDNKYSEHYVDEKDNAYVTSNMRVLVENNWLYDLKYLCEPTEYHEKRITVKFITQIAITREINRHRSNSMAESSTRYCDYNNNKKFDGVGINVPSWVSNIYDQESLSHCDETLFEQLQKEYASISDDGMTKEDWGTIEWWLWSMFTAEESYQNMRRLGLKPQDARTVLPLSTNTELIHTGFISDWDHFFELRCAKSAYPDIQILANELKEKMYAYRK